MRLDPCKTQGNDIPGKIRHGLRTGKQSRAGSLVDARGARSRHVDCGIGVDQSAVVIAQQIAALPTGEEAREFLPRLGKHPAQAVEEPLDLASAAKEDSAQNQCEATLRVR